MAIVSEYNPTNLSNWLKYDEGVATGVTHETLTLPVGGMISGSVLTADGELVGTANAEDAAYILITDLTNWAHAEMLECVVLARGHAIVGREALIFASGVTEVAKETALAALKEKNIHAVKVLDLA